MALYPGLDYCGQVEVVDISIPRPAVEKNPPKAILCTDPQPCEYLQLRKNPQAHKGTFGHLLIVGGSPGKTGAPAMAAVAASRIGAGLVTVGVPASLNHILEVKLTEEMTEPLPETIPGYLGEPSVERVLALAAGKQCLVLGPGMSTNDGASELVKKVLEDYTGWVLIDADGLNALAPNMSALNSSEARIVLTPHPGEMARLTGTTAKHVQQDRVELTRKTAVEYGVWIVLKGARTLTADPHGSIYVNTTGNPWMASGGQGDALSGILGGLLVQGIPPEEALPFGVYLHGLAADRIVERSGPRPVVATDVIAEIPSVLTKYNYDGDREGTSCFMA
jgi:NAD(P)H-hydrate epimerase